MKKFFLIVLLMFSMGLLSTMSCSYQHVKYDDPWSKTDREANKVQDLLESSVKIRNDLMYALITDVEKLPPAMRPPGVHGTVKVPLPGVSQGSGTVFNDRTLGSFVVTAGHVCKMDNVIRTSVGPALLVGGKFSIETVHGVKMDARVILIDGGDDVCVLKIDKVLAKASTFASSLPPIGATLIGVGGTLGRIGKDVGVVADGRYVGLETSPEGETIMLTTMQIDSGFSGGGIYYKGKYVGMITRYYGNVGALSGATPLAAIVADLKIAQDFLRK